MPNPNQRNIPVDKDEGAELQRRKDLYEQKTGQKGDWGKALGVLTLGGLAALGIYALVKATQPTPTTWQVICPNTSCKAIFPVATTGSPARLSQIACPYCQTEMVVDFGSAQERGWYRVDGQSPLAPGATVNMNCHHCHRQMQLTITAGRRESGAKALQCPFCGVAASYGIGDVTKK